ncbi:MAG: hypothetical protein WC802_03315 [Patescibacteria group bacterium]|jgi:hypothetical protein
MKEKFSASGDVEAWFKKGEEHSESDKDFDPLLNVGTLDISDAPEKPAAVELEPIGDEDSYADEITDKIIRPSEPVPTNVIPFPKETKASWLTKARDYAKTLYAEVIPLPKPVEKKKSEPVKPLMTEGEMNEEIAEGNPAISAWFKNTERSTSAERDEEEREVA